MSSGKTLNPDLLLMDRTVLCMSLMCEELSPCCTCVQSIYHLITVVYRPSGQLFFSKKCSKKKFKKLPCTKQQTDTISKLVDKADEKRQMFPSGVGADRNRSKKKSEYKNTHSPGSQKTKCVISRWFVVYLEKPLVSLCF